MKQNIIKALICFTALLVCFSLAALLGLLTADFVQAVKSKPEQSQIYSNVTFEVIETADSAYKPYYSENGYLYIYRDGRLQEVR